MKWSLVVALIVLIAVAVKVRRTLNDPESDWGRWFQARVRPKLQDIVMGIFLITFLVWAGIYVTAPEEDRDILSQSMKELWESVVQPAGGGDAPPDRAPARP